MRNSKGEFLVLQEIDNKIFLSLMKRSRDILVLDEVDQKILLWLLTNSPKRLRSWVEYLACDYRKRKSIEINAAQLLSEANELRHSQNSYK
jgi:hypothetical protein